MDICFGVALDPKSWEQWIWAMKYMWFIVSCFFKKSWNLMNHIFEFMVEINWTRLNFTNLRNQTISHSTCRHYHLRLFVDRLSYATGIMLGNPKRKMIRAKYLDLWHPFLILCSLSTTYLESFSCSQQRILMEKWFQKISYPVKPILVSKFTPKKHSKN